MRHARRPITAAAATAALAAALLAAADAPDRPARPDAAEGDDAISPRIRKRRFEVSSHRPVRLSHPAWVQGGRITLPHCFHIPRFGDVDGDGELEMIVCRGAGQQSAVDLDGRRLWRYRDEHADGRPCRVDSKLPLYDLDGDGKLELVCVRVLDGRPKLCVVNAADGSVKHARPIAVAPREPHLSVIPAWLEGAKGPPSLVVHRDYWRIEVYTHDLKERRWVRNVPELGHTTVASDLDGDGREELWVGTRLFGPDGRTIWSKPELLEGTGESHPDSLRVADLDADGEPELVFAPGGRVLAPDGRIRWALKGVELTEVQSVRLLRTGRRRRIAWTDHPFTGKGTHLRWRGFRLRDVRSRTVITDHAGKALAAFDGLHTPEPGDWDGDGDDELFMLARSGDVMEVRDADGEVVDRIAIPKRVYISDMLVLPCLPGARGAQLVLHEFGPGGRRTWCAIYENTRARGRCPPFDQLRMARQTCY